MDERISNIIKFSGLMFMGVSTVLFYNHLFTAAGNPGFFVIVYFNYYGEFLGEFLLFILFIPVIMFAVFLYVKEILEHVIMR